MKKQWQVKKGKLQMKLLTKENIVKNQVDTIDQFKVLDYLKKQLSIDESTVYLIDRFTIKVVDKTKNKDILNIISKQNW